MNIKEAILWQVVFKNLHNDNYAQKGANIACDMAIVALKKQESERPYINDFYYFCPCCGTRRSIKQKHKYCHECGKKFDWSKGE